MLTTFTQNANFFTQNANFWTQNANFLRSLFLELYFLITLLLCIYYMYL